MTPEEIAALRAELAKENAALEAGGGAGDTDIAKRTTPGQRQVGQLAHAVGGSLASETILPFVSRGATAVDNWITGGDKKPLTADDVARGRAYEEATQGTGTRLAIEGTGEVAGMLPFMKAAKAAGFAGRTAKSLAAQLFAAKAGKEATTNTLPDLATGAEEPGYKTVTGPLGAGALEAAGGPVAKVGAKIIAPAATALQTYGKALSQPVLERAQELIQRGLARGITLNADEAALQAAQELGDTASEGQLKVLQQKLANDLAKTDKLPERTAAGPPRTQKIDMDLRDARAADDMAMSPKAAAKEDVMKNRIGIHPEAEKLRMEITRGHANLGGARADSATALEETRAELQRRMLGAGSQQERAALKEQLDSVDDVLQREAPTRAEAYPHRDEAFELQRLDRATTGNPLPAAIPEPPKSLLERQLPRIVQGVAGLGGSGGALAGLVGGSPLTLGAGLAAAGATGLHAANRALDDRAIPIIADMSMKKADDFLAQLGAAAPLGESVGGAAAAEGLGTAVPGLLGAIPDTGPNFRQLFQGEDPQEALERRRKGRKQRYEDVFGP